MARLDQHVLIVPCLPSPNPLDGLLQERYEKKEMQERVKKAFDKLKTESWTVGPSRER